MRHHQTKFGYKMSPVQKISLGKSLTHQQTDKWANRQFFSIPPPNFVMGEGGGGIATNKPQNKIHTLKNKYLQALTCIPSCELELFVLNTGYMVCGHWYSATYKYEKPRQHMRSTKVT